MITTRLMVTGWLAALVVLLSGCPSNDGITPGLLDVPGNGDIQVPEVVTPPNSCDDDGDCPGQVCNPVTHTCVECVVTSDCGPKQKCEKWKCEDQAGCEADADCEDGFVCDEEVGVCVECLEDADCPEGTCFFNHCVLPCDNGCPVGFVCDELTNMCIQCVTDEDCLEEEWCNTTEYACYEDQCLPYALSCVGNSVAECAANGSGWSNLKPCPTGHVCKEGECIEEQICEPGLTSCKDDHTLQICNGDGTELLEKPCAPDELCENGFCTGECVPDCDGKECGDSGCPGFSCGVCQEGAHCGDDFQCHWGICTEGDVKCVGSGVALCMGGDQGWSEPQPCPPGTVCSDGACVDDEQCEPGMVACDGNAIVKCLEEGVWKFIEECPPDAWCEDGQCVFEPEQCKPGQLACEGHTVIQCADNGMEWFVLFDCPPDSKCWQGECIGGPNECIPGKTTCKDNWVLECVDEGVWKEAYPCPPGMSCKNGECWPGVPGECKDYFYCFSDFVCFEPDPVCMEPCFQDVGDPPDIMFELYYCVFKMCGMWDPNSGCFEFALGQECSWLYETCVGGGPCIPKCGSKDCGPDGCGGSCGQCPAGSSCNTGGICEIVCVPNCTGKECGSDGCGGACGLCGAGEACKSGKCIASLSCLELSDCVMSCPQGNEQCGGQCWADASPAAKQQWMALMGCVQEVCGENGPPNCAGQAIWGECVDYWNKCQDCTPACVGKQCGADGCGGSCGQCPGGFTCDNYGSCMCEPQCGDKECGPNGCGGSCGTCPGGSVCNYLGHCVCMPQCLDKQCGNDGCGGSCGVCPAGLICSPDGLCGGGPKPCGNNMCEPWDGENCQTCPKDCGPCDMTCCEPHDMPGCNDEWVMMCVCKFAPHCCMEWWSDECVELAMWECGAPCEQPGCGDGQCDPWMEESCWNCPMDCGPCEEGDCCQEHEFPGCADPDVMWCVCEMDPFCCEVMWDGLCVDEAQQCGAQCGCVPNCQGKQCGADGCGGSCGQCPPGTQCNNQGQCGGPNACGNGWCQQGQGENCKTCPQDCGPCAACGDGECWGDGESCITCPQDCGACAGSCCQAQNGPGCENIEVMKCVCAMDPYCCDTAWDGICVSEAQQDCGADCPCIPNCQGKQCGPDGCGGSCGQCPPGVPCNNQGQCGAPDACGNGWCQNWQGETCETCPQDCGECPKCGDGQCQADGGENCQSCPEDCGPCNGGSCCEAHQSVGCDDPEITQCVCAMDPYCCQQMWDDICVDEAINQCKAQCDDPCEPQCWTADGTIMECGPDGCGGVCGICNDASQCVNGKCVGVCQPNCVNDFGMPKNCGADGCGGVCGTCPSGQQCNEQFGFCVPGCQPNCAGKECGDDGCGGSCGACPGDMECQNGQCVGQPTYNCSNMVACAMECGFGVGCTMGCYGNGDAQSQQLFQSVTWCVVQECGWNIDAACVQQALAGGCADEFKACLADQ